MMLRPSRGGFLRPFGCGWFIREFLSGNAPYGSSAIDPDTGAPQADIFHFYKIALISATAYDRATRLEEKMSRKSKRTLSPEVIEKLAQEFLVRSKYKGQGAAIILSWSTSPPLKSWDGWNPQGWRNHPPSKPTIHPVNHVNTSG